MCVCIYIYHGEWIHTEVTSKLGWLVVNKTDLMIKLLSQSYSTSVVFEHLSVWGMLSGIFLKWYIFCVLNCVPECFEQLGRNESRTK